MIDAGMIEAIRAVQAPQSMAVLNELAASRAADADAVKAFQAAMGADGPDPVPFAQQIGEAWRSAQDLNQGILHRIHALSERRLGHSPSVAALTELQYEVANLSFQQEVVTNVAKKASSAVETLVKNG